ncbi:MAG: GGDEF domain-containing protein [Rhodoferax sp.]|nr:GGDEF domain-containing protein [Actinomycetota bacterium]
MSSPDASLARPPARFPYAVDGVAAALALGGSLALALTLDLAWVAVLVLAVALTGLGVGSCWRGAVAVIAAVVGWLTGFALFLAEAGRITSAQRSSWALSGLALLAAAGVAVLTRARSERERAETDRAIERAQDVAVHDALTGLTNRRGLALLGGQILESARRRGDAVYCIFVDVDGLSRVNEELGHSAGDDVLLTVAEGLRRSTRATDAVARWGDDEFVVVGPGTGLAPLEMERRIRAHCVEHTSIDRRIWQARVSAGGSVLEPWDDGTVDTMLRLAGREMHLRRALRREAGAPAYRPTRLEQSPQRPHPRHPGGWQG